MQQGASKESPLACSIQYYTSTFSRRETDAKICFQLYRTNEIDFPKKKSKKQKDEEQKYGCNYEAIMRLGKKHNYTTSWGPIGFKKANHPLAIMVCSLLAPMLCSTVPTGIRLAQNFKLLYS